MISAIVLAAGLSTRMAAPKMLLPWGQTTVIGKVISTLLEAEISDIHLVTGGLDTDLKELLQGYPVNFVFNEQYQNGEMLTSIQVGLNAVSDEVDAILVVLGDQPQIEAKIVKIIIARYTSTKHEIIVPSYRMHRGHPWLLGKSYWAEILELLPPLTLRDFLNKHREIIDYVSVNTPSVIQDIDTQEDYYQLKP